MRQKIKRIAKFITDEFSIYCVLILIVLSADILFEIPLVGVPVLIIAFIMQGTEKIKERDKND